MKTVLLVSYIFPPAGGAGVQRALKFVKYLGGFGWRPVVLTPDRPSVPVLDPSLARDLPPGQVVRRLPSCEPPAPAEASTSGEARGAGLSTRLKALASGLLFPDRHVLWLPTALYGAIMAARRYQADAVLVTGPPFSAFVLGWAVARWHGLPLVLDFRDDWSGFFSKGFAAKGGGRLWQMLVRRLEGLLVGAASRVIGNTPEMTEGLRRRHGGPAAKYVWIPNGYDLEDFAVLKDAPAGPPPRDGRPLKLLYTGTVFQSHPLDDLWAAFALLSPAQRRGYAVEIVGRVVPGQVVDPGLEGLNVRVLPYEPHHQVIRRMAGADVLVLTLAGLPGLELMVPAKLFEYLAVRRPVLGILPRGAASQIVEATNAGAVVQPGQPSDLAGLLAGWLRDPPAPLAAPPGAFDRRVLAGQLARALDQALAAAGQRD
ncbi:MAG: glycosyltransferase family 4 protein [Desulfarculus sp.]|nr:glycosyltransferase family 4 protein [Desulfarculus sp.]